MTAYIYTAPFRRYGIKRRVASKGSRPAWMRYFGDEKREDGFSLHDTPRENETLRRNTCQAGHIYSVTVSSCPQCGASRARQRAGVWTNNALRRVAKR